MNNLTNKHIDAFIVEILERAVRLINLADRSSNYLRAATLRETAQSASSKTIKKLVSELIIEPIISSFPSGDNHEKQIKYLHSIYETVVAIHEYALPTTPRPIEPIELKSFFRQNKNVTGIEQNIHVFASDHLGIQIFPGSITTLLKNFSDSQKKEALAKFSNVDLMAYAKQKLVDENSTLIPNDITEKHIPSIAIPAVDIHNPNRWPSLFHELGHHKLETSPDQELLEQFVEYISSDVFDEICDNISTLSESQIVRISPNAYSGEREHLFWPNVNTDSGST